MAICASMVLSVWLAITVRGPEWVTLTYAIEASVVVEFLAMLLIVRRMRRRLAYEVERVVTHRDELLRLNQRQEVAQRVAKLAYFDIEADGEVHWSDEMYRLCGLDPTPGPPPTDRYLESIHPEDRERIAQVAQLAVAEQRPFTEQYRIGRPGSPFRTVQAQGNVVAGVSGAARLVGTVQDITDRVALETQLRQSQKMDAIGKLAGGVAHDFNNLITVIEAYSTFVLENPNAPPDVKADATEIRDAGTRAAALTAQLLAFSRQQVFCTRAINLNTAVKGVEGMLRRLIGEHIQVHTNLDPHLGLVRSDAGQLDQVLVNLLVNARDAMPDGGQVSIETSNVMLDEAYGLNHPGHRSGPHVLLTVSDTGTGMTAEICEQIFEPFFTTKETGKGTGLGLATVHGIIEQSGGHIRVDSEPGHGTSFKAYLPRTEDGIEEETPVRHPGTRKGGQERILVVEDEVSVRNATSRMLRSAGYLVHEAADGDAAIAICSDRSNAIDLVITDMIMPGLSGARLIERIPAICTDVKILLMSGYARDTIANWGAPHPYVAFIEKPFTAAGLSRKVRAVLDA